MKKIISLLLAFVLAFSTLILVSCDDKDSDGDPAVTTTVTTPEDDKDDDDGKKKKDESVDSVNGMNAKQLYEKFYEEYLSAKSYDLSTTSTTKVEGVSMTLNIEIKLNEESMYMCVSSDESTMSFWLVDGVVYVDYLGEKICGSMGSMEEILGMSFEEYLRDTVSEALDEVDMDLFLKKLDSTKIYPKGDGYYFSYTISDEEAEQMIGEDAKGYKDTVYVDAQGRVEKVITKSEDEEIVMVLNSYGDPVTISAPENADEFINITEGGPGDEDPDIYAIYEELLRKLDDAEIYQLRVNMDNSSIFQYRMAEDGEQLIVYKSDGSDYYWYVDGQAYMYDSDANETVEIEMTDPVLSMFEDARGVIEEITTYKIGGALMDNLKLGDDLIDIGLLDISFESGDDTYSFVFDEDMSTIDITLEKYGVGTLQYSFSKINDSDLSSNLWGI